MWLRYFNFRYLIPYGIESLSDWTGFQEPGWPVALTAWLFSPAVFNFLLPMSVTGGLAALAMAAVEKAGGGRLPARMLSKLYGICLLLLLFPAHFLELNFHADWEYSLLLADGGARPNTALRQIQSAAGFIKPLVCTVVVAGILAALLCHLYRAAKFWRALRGARPLEDGRTLELLEEAKRMTGVRRRVRVRSWEGARTPFLTGVAGVTVVLPPWHFPDADLRHIFLHELSHQKRRDLWVRRLENVLRVLHWFNPALRLLCGRLDALRERACDEAAAKAAGDRSAYAQTLLRVAVRSFPAQAGALPMGVGVAGRITALVTPERPGRLRAAAFGLLAALALGGLLAAGQCFKTWYCISPLYIHSFPFARAEVDGSVSDELLPFFHMYQDRIDYASLRPGLMDALMNAGTMRLAPNQGTLVLIAPELLEQARDPALADALLQEIQEEVEDMRACTGARSRKLWTICFMPDGQKSYVIATDTTEISLFGYKIEF